MSRKLFAFISILCYALLCPYVRGVTVCEFFGIISPLNVGR